MYDTLGLSYQTESRPLMKKGLGQGRKKTVDITSYKSTKLLTIPSLPKHRPISSFSGSLTKKASSKSNKLLNSETKSSILKKNSSTMLGQFGIAKEPNGRNKEKKKKNLSFNINNMGKEGNNKSIANSNQKLTSYDRKKGISQSMNSSSKKISTEANISSSTVKQNLQDKINSALESSIIDQQYENEIKNDEIILNDEVLNPVSSFDEKKNSNTIADFESLKNDFDIFYTDEYIKSVSDEMIQLELQLIIEKMFDIQNAYHKEYSVSLNNYKLYNSVLREHYNKYYKCKKEYYEYSKRKDKLEIKKNKKEYLHALSLFKEEMKVLMSVIEKSNPINLSSNNKEIDNILLKQLFLIICQKAKNKLDSSQKEVFIKILRKKVQTK